MTTDLVEEEEDMGVPGISSTASGVVLSELLARVEAATGADRELDHAVWRAAFFERSTSLSVAQDDPAQPSHVWVDEGGKPIRKTIGGVWRWEPPTRPFREGEWVFDGEDGRHYSAYVNVSSITASLDAALALVERVLPGWAWMIGCSEAGDFFASLQPSIGDDPFNGEGEDGNGKTPALALLCALLRSLIDQGNENV